MSDRAVSPVVGIALLVAIVVLLSATAAVVLTGIADQPGEPPETAIRPTERTVAGCQYTYATVDTTLGDGLVYYEQNGERVTFDDDGDGQTEVGEGRRLPPRGEVTLIAERDDQTYVIGEYGAGGDGCLAMTSSGDPNVTAEHGIRYDVTDMGGSGTVGNSLNEVTITYGSNASVDASGVSADDVTAAGFDRDGDPDIDVSTMDDLQSVSVTNGGRTITVQFVGNYDVRAGDEIRISFSDVSNPLAAGTYNVTVDINGDVSRTGTLRVG